MSARARAIAQTRRSFQQALRNVDRAVTGAAGPLSEVNVNKAMRGATQQLQGDMTNHITDRTKVPKFQIKRRLKRFFRKGGGKRSGYVEGPYHDVRGFQTSSGLVLGDKASVIHAGRIKGRRGRLGKVKSIPGINLRGPAFVLKVPQSSNEERNVPRIYQRVGGQIESVNHPLRIKEVFETYGKMRAQQLVREITAKMTRRAQSNLNRLAAARSLSG